MIKLRQITNDKVAKEGEHIGVHKSDPGILWDTDLERFLATQNIQVKYFDSRRKTIALFQRRDLRWFHVRIPTHGLDKGLKFIDFSSEAPASLIIS